MEQALKEKAPVPVEVWAVAAKGKARAAVKAAAKEKAVARAQEGAKVAAEDRGKDEVTHETSELLSE